MDLCSAGSLTGRTLSQIRPMGPHQNEDAATRGRLCRLLHHLLESGRQSERARLEPPSRVQAEETLRLTGGRPSDSVARMQALVEAGTWYVAFLFSVTAHEAAHAWSARRGGDWTAHQGGQVSLDPLPHIRREPFGMVILPLISLFLIHWPFGYASAPYDPLWAERYPRRAAVMSLSGPLANLALAVVAGMLIRLGLAAGPLESPVEVNMTQVVAARASEGVWVGIALLLSILFSLNLMLALLNLLPLPPLDGSDAVTLLMPEGAAARFRRFIRNPAFGWVGLVVAWNIFGPIFSPVFTFALNLLYPGAHFG